MKTHTLLSILGLSSLLVVPSVTLSWGISASSNEGGGVFSDSNDSGFARVGVGENGIEAFGNINGGYFYNPITQTSTFLASPRQGIAAYASEVGGLFVDNDDSGIAWVGYGDTGIDASGNIMGGKFEDANSSGIAFIGNGDEGIRAAGDTLGGVFIDSNSSSWTNVGYETYKIYGTGSVNFVQNHPENKDEVIVYTAPEGDEVATYTRGNAQLVDGEARIPLGETFKWVTNPNIGLTAHLTSTKGWSVLYVVSKTTDELVVRSAPGFPDDVEFDYLVYGLRIGFEDTTVVQKKTEEARIPFMAYHQKQFEANPELHQYTALSRYARMQGKDRASLRQEMHAAASLLDKIEVFDPDVQKISTPEASTEE